MNDRSVSRNRHADVLAFAHKMEPPQAHSGTIVRRDLISRVCNASDKKLILVHAPAGHGKTSLLLQLKSALNDNNVDTRWLSIDEFDNDNRRFLGSIQYLFSQLNDSIADEPTTGHKLAKPEQARNWIASRLAGLNRPVTIFVDDLHFVKGTTTITLLRQLINESPANLRWIVASRISADLGMPRLLVTDSALVIKAKELRFSKQEAKNFLRQNEDYQLTNDEQDAIYQATGGWPAALQLYRLTVGSQSVRDSLRSPKIHHPKELTDYLADNVLANQSPAKQEFLLKTSLLKRMSASLCDHILDRSDSEQMLSELESGGLFVRKLHSQDGWYDYHAIFVRFLRDHAARLFGQEEIKRIHRSAADWHYEKMSLENALDHYCRAESYSVAAEVFDQYSDDLVSSGQMTTVEYWSEKLPFSILRTRLSLIVKIAWALTFLVNRNDKLSLFLPLVDTKWTHKDGEADHTVVLCMAKILQDDLKEAVEIVAAIDVYKHPANKFRAFELGAVCNARGYAAMASGDFDIALQFFEHGRSLSDRTGATFSWAYSIGKSGVALISNGQLKEALVLIRGALSEPDIFVSESLSQGCLTSAFIMALYEADEHDEALAQFEKFRDLAPTELLHDYLFVAYNAVSKIYDLRGEDEKALEILDEAESIAFAGQWPRVIRLIKWARVQRELAAGRIEQAKLVAGRILPNESSMGSNWVRFSEETNGDDIGQVRLDIHTGNPDRALQLINELLSYDDNNSRIYRKIKLNTLAALAEKQRNNYVGSHRYLEKALHLAAPGGYYRTVLEEGVQISELLLAHAQARKSKKIRMKTFLCDCNDDSVQFLAQLIRYSEEESEPILQGLEGRLRKPEEGTDPFEGFTKREKQCLLLVAQFQSNEQIAEEMAITKDTLKYHLKNIYGKLYVNSRLDAIRVAREMGIK